MVATPSTIALGADRRERALTGNEKDEIYRVERGIAPDVYSLPRAGVSAIRAYSEEVTVGHSLHFRPIE